jgi:hypothetical protein
MAFCTSCGGQVKGAFCEQCGTPVSASGGAAQPPSPAPPAMSPPPPAYAAPQAPPPTKGKIHPIVWVLVGLFGLFVIGVVAVIGAGFFFARSVAQNPGAWVARAITMGNPNAEVVNTDNRAQTVTIRDKKTGEEVTLSFDDVKNGKFKMSAVGKNGEVGTVEIGGGEGKLPSWVPSYPGAKATGNFTAQGTDASGRGSGGVVAFESGDPPSKVMQFYKDKIDGLGMKVNSQFTGGDTGMLIAAEDDNKRTLQVTVGNGSGGGSSISITFSEKR